ncbi:MAG: TRAP transporter small permease, partial [Pseudomonadota bacterium]
LAAFGQLVAAVVLFVLCWRLWVHADRLAHDGGVTNSLALPLAPIGYFAALSCALSGLIALLRTFNRR